MQTYMKIARELSRLVRGEAENQEGWAQLARLELSKIMETAPSLSGIDSGVQLDEDSTPERLVFRCDFHHMDEHGCYDGWTYHRCIVKPSLAWGFDLRITGRDRNGIKEYLGDVMHEWLTSE